MVSFRPVLGGVCRPWDRISSASSGIWKSLRNMVFKGHQKNCRRGFLVVWAPAFSSSVPSSSHLLSLHVGHRFAFSKSPSKRQQPFTHMSTLVYGTSNVPCIAIACWKDVGKFVDPSSSSKFSRRISQSFVNEDCVKFSSKFHSNRSNVSRCAFALCPPCTLIAPT